MEERCRNKFIWASTHVETAKLAVFPGVVSPTEIFRGI
jgi:hypothetical protein